MIYIISLRTKIVQFLYKKINQIKNNNKNFKTQKTYIKKLKFTNSLKKMETQTSRRMRKEGRRE